MIAAFSRHPHDLGRGHAYALDPELPGEMPTHLVDERHLIRLEADHDRDPLNGAASASHQRPPPPNTLPSSVINSSDQSDGATG
jgi:hypothetical protein